MVYLGQLLLSNRQRLDCVMLGSKLYLACGFEVVQGVDGFSLGSTRWPAGAGCAPGWGGGSCLQTVMAQEGKWEHEGASEDPGPGQALCHGPLGKAGVQRNHKLKDRGPSASEGGRGNCEVTCERV